MFDFAFGSRGQHAGARERNHCNSTSLASQSAASCLILSISNGPVAPVSDCNSAAFILSVTGG
jgi:hypothetical protein